MSEIEQRSGSESVPTGYSEFLVIRGCTEICFSRFFLRTMSDSGCNIFCLLNMGSFESKHNYFMLLTLFKLTTCFDSCTGPSSGHKIYN